MFMCHKYYSDFNNVREKDGPNVNATLDNCTIIRITAWSSTEKVYEVIANAIPSGFVIELGAGV